MGGVTHARLENLETETFWERSFRADLKLEDLPLERQILEFLYSDGDQCCFTNPESYDQTEIAKAMVGPQAGFFEGGMRLSVEFVEGRPVSVLFPEMLEVKIAETGPPMHQQQDSTFKPARLENGIELTVPQFVRAAM